MPEVPKKCMEYFRKYARNYRKIRIFDFCSDFLLKIGIFSQVRGPLKKYIVVDAAPFIGRKYKC